MKGFMRKRLLIFNGFCLLLVLSIIANINGNNVQYNERVIINDNETGACYGNRKYLGIATDVGWQESATTNRQYKYNDVKKDDCHLISANSCNSLPINVQKIMEETTDCEGTKDIYYTDLTKCNNSDDSGTNTFYTIECTRKISTEFDYGDDDNTCTTRELYNGQGFKYGVTVKSIHTCTAVFNKEAWMNAFNRYLKKLEYISPSLVDYVKKNDYNGWVKKVESLQVSKEEKSEIYELWNNYKELRDVVINDYLGFVPENNYNEKVNIKIVANKENIVDQDLIISENDYSNGEYKKIISSQKFDLVDQKELKNIPEYFVVTNEDNPRFIKFIPSKVYIEKYSGEKNNNNNGSVDGGNKIYVDYNMKSEAFEKTYNMIIKVDGLGSNNSEITNNKCDIKSFNSEIKYRSIDVSNPFINSSWKIGENWLNNKYSFTNVIKSDTWKMSSIADVVLSSSEMKDLKNSNANYQSISPYLGLCDQVNDNLKDSVTAKICNIIKETIDDFQ